MLALRLLDEDRPRRSSALELLLSRVKLSADKPPITELRAILPNEPVLRALLEVGVVVVAVREGARDGVLALGESDAERVEHDPVAQPSAR